MYLSRKRFQEIFSVNTIWDKAHGEQCRPTESLTAPPSLDLTSRDVKNTITVKTVSTHSLIQPAYDGWSAPGIGKDENRKICEARFCEIFLYQACKADRRLCAL